MARFGLRAGILSLFFVLALCMSLAQTDEAINVKGSAIVSAVLSDLEAASQTDNLSIKERGTWRGIEAFCGGETDLAPATRKMTADERAACEANDISYSELLLGHHIAAIVANTEAPTQCLQFDALQDLLKPSASNTITDWSFASEEHADLPLRLALPQESALAYHIADSLIAGDGLRQDGSRYQDSGDALAMAADEAGALALVHWTGQLALHDETRVLEIASNLGSCAPPSAETVESGDYPLAISLYLYVNRAKLEEKASLAAFLHFASTSEGAALIDASGATAATSAIFDLNRKLLADADAAPGVTGSADDYVIPAELSGDIQIVGAAIADPILKRAAADLGGQVNASMRYAGSAEGLNQLCHGEADIAVLDGQADADALAVCAENGIRPVPVALGAQATVLLANAGDDFAACLTSEQINTIWRAESADLVMTWSDVAESLPDQAMILFAPSALDSHSDMLLQTAGQPIPPMRRDTETNRDPLYRAAAVGNVSGSLTMMSWHEYQNVLENSQARIQLVAVDAGAGCVEATEASISAGQYPLARAASLLVREASLAAGLAQALLWQIHSDANWAALQADGFISAPALELPILRRDLLRRFAEAESLHPRATESDGESADEANAESGG